MQVDHTEMMNALLAEGCEIVGKIRGTRSRRRRDGLGRKAAGIWAQAQVHATAALAEAAAARERDNWLSLDCGGIVPMNQVRYFEQRDVNRTWYAILPGSSFPVEIAACEQERISALIKPSASAE